VLRRRLYEADISGSILQLEPQLRVHRLRCANGACGAADGPAANELGLGRGQLADFSDRPPVPAQLPGLWPVRRTVPADTRLAERHGAVWRVLRAGALVV